MLSRNRTKTDSSRQADAPNTFRGDHTDPAPAPTSTGAEPGYQDTRPGCTCGGYTFRDPSEEVDPRTGEVSRPTYTRRNTSVFCPIHGVNEDFRDSFAAHAAWVARRDSFRRCDCHHVTVCLHEADAERLGLDATETQPVLSQLLPRLWMRKHRKDPDAEVLISLSPRPGDGAWHMHVLYLSKGATTDEVREIFDLAGTDTCVTTPRSREETTGGAPKSAEQFAAAMGAYLFDNRVQGAVQGAETKFSSWGEGVGYFSNAAKERRREYAEQMAEAGGDTAPARCSSTQIPTDGDGAPGENGTNGAGIGAAPPVSVGVDAVQSEAEYRRVVMAALLDRMHTDVRVQGMGRCKLTWAEAGGDHLIICYVRPLEQTRDDQRAVPWGKIAATDTPVIRKPSDTDSPPAMSADDAADAPDEETPEPTEAEEKAEQFWDEARYSRSTLVLPDGRRHVRKTDHRTGEVTEEIKPPRDE